ncbi:MAG: PD-(D/E)XK nuclease family protein [Bacteroidales bacterium]|nr:PD-(D/E)XK nuclease family protein [Bacteroidales bacterium]MDD2204533.1 PD-(D/E)XK nuclease family protein [Bacteroidales bacterium]MDD3913473.1 PD-(D/E)XK nuclease family protein [Bacteroidales bacterium]MDD4633963.1 PD-(D/E)XK nuclease family protein [Bacteroidales bacterium]
MVENNNCSTTFLQQTTQLIISKYEQNLMDLCLVVPNNRAKTHLQHEIFNSLHKANFAPEIMSIQEFITALAAVKKTLITADTVTLLLKFYEVHCKISDDKSFTNFLGWASSALKDFNEIDLYMADAEHTFNYLSEAKAIELWSPEKQQLTDFEKHHIEFLSTLKKYYSELRKLLFDNNLCYSGQLYRYVAENIEEISQSITWEKILFIGFNALSKSEITIFDHLHKSQTAEFIWDADKYYVENEMQEAGLFLRRHLKLWNDENAILSNCFSMQKNITIINTAGNIQQTKIAHKILVDNDFDADETVIVLADENLLLPMLNSIPEKYNKPNITLGVPLAANPINKLIADIFSLHTKAICNNNKESCYKTNYINKIVQNPIFKILIKNECILQIEINNILKKEILSADIIADLSGKTLETNLLDFLLPWNNNSLQALETITILLNKLYNTISKLDGYVIETEIIINLLTIFDEIKTDLKSNTVINEVANLAALIKYYLEEVSVSFKSEPLRGLQILGLLETRLLDFKNVIILSLNEDILPKKTPLSNFLTYEIIKENKMPSEKEKNAVFAYHFYRLIQRSQNIYLIYNSAEGSIGTNEKSRYIAQLIYEQPTYNPDTVIRQKTYINSNKLINSNKIDVIEKDDTVMKYIKAFLKKNISPSAFNTYIDCQLKFYYRYILGVKDTTDSELIDPAMMGTLIHDTLHTLYNNKLNNRLTKDDFIEIEKNIEQAIEDSFKKQKIEAESGRNLLLKRLIQNYVTAMIKSDKYKVETNNTLIIRQLENSHLQEVKIDNTTSITLYGIIDRIEEVNGQIRIMDYKTGNTGEKSFEINDNKFFAAPNTKAIQLLLYSYLIYYNKHISNFSAGLYALRHKDFSTKQVKEVMISTLIDDDTIDKISDFVKQIVIEIKNSDQSFTSTTSKNICSSCNYKLLCGRQ